MNPLQLKNSANVTARGVTPESSHSATHIRITSLDIHISDVEQGGCTITYEMGNMVGGSFVVLAVEQPNHIQSMELNGDTFDLLANTPIAPAERSMTVYDILRTRIYDYMESQNLIVLEE